MATVELIGSEFERIHGNLLDVLELIPEDRLYWKPFESESFIRVYSCGELITHIGGAIEYAFNGITTSFWEEPFEWITREALPTRSHVAAYLEETARVRRIAFSDLKDEDLPKLVYYPDVSRTTIGEILIRTLTHTSHHRGQVYAYVHLFSDARLPVM
ncbi:MAG TPA: DinB family protein [Blastocatellia bacterium]|nr:DinB family protein [Blastocatellia bacterium]